MTKQTSKKSTNPKEDNTSSDLARNERRRGTPTFSAIRHDRLASPTANQKEKASVDAIIEKHGGTRREALLAAFALLDVELTKEKMKTK